jgi:NUMOD3 motif
MKIYLYVKQHRKTGLKYFGMTATKDPYVYCGSGKYWRRHLKQHGLDIDTVSVWEFEDRNECENFALEFSLKENIVESTEWANLRPENGRDGKAPGSPGMKKESNPNFGKTKELNSFYGKKHSNETKALYRKQKKGANNPRAKKVITPYGEFGCVKEAAQALKINRDKLSIMIRGNTEGYMWA